ncbi:MAG TPA: hypothetical protein VM681_02255 [Candidatus Thermoplasmatota archaeon]|nr:hypothetical protein [Candidatus Thermoplasmatota archaeon]
MNRVFEGTDDLLHIVLRGEQTLDGIEWAFDEVARHVRLRRNRAARVRLLVDTVEARMDGHHRRKIESCASSSEAERVALSGAGMLHGVVGNLRLRASGTDARVRWVRANADAREFLLHGGLSTSPADRASAAEW